MRITLQVVVSERTYLLLLVGGPVLPGAAERARCAFVVVTRSVTRLVIDLVVVIYLIIIIINK